MLYSIHITSINNKRAGTIVAHNIAGNRNVSLHYAMSLLENLPLIYITDLTKDEADATLKQLINIGVQANILKKEIENIAPPDEDDVDFQPFKQPEAAPLKSVPAPAPAPVNQIKPVSFIYKEVPSGNDSAKNDNVKRDILIAGAIVGTFAVLIFLLSLINAGHKNKNGYHPTVVPSALLSDSIKPSSSYMHGKDGSNSKDKAPLKSSRKAVSQKSRMQAQAFTDSAKASTTTDGAIAFYKMAIGFNKYNVDAWYGLVNSYKCAEMNKEAKQALEEMKKLFGEDVLSLSQVITRYGELMDCDFSSDGTYRVEYRSRAADTAVMTREVWQIVKALGLQCNCKAFSVYAHNDAGGILAYVKTDPRSATFDQFMSNATVRYFAP